MEPAKARVEASSAGSGSERLAASEERLRRNAETTSAVTSSLCNKHKYKNKSMFCEKTRYRIM